MSDFPEIKSTHSLVAKHVTPELWAKVIKAINTSSARTNLT